MDLKEFMTTKKQYKRDCFVMMKYCTIDDREREKTMTITEYDPHLECIVIYQVIKNQMTTQDIHEQKYMICIPCQYILEKTEIKKEKKSCKSD